MGSCKSQELEGEELAKRVWVNGAIIVGAGPSGLAVAVCLSNRGIPFVILERGNCITSFWKNRTYDCLKLHLPKEFWELPLMGFPHNFPKHHFISYMESYASRFSVHPSPGSTKLFRVPSSTRVVGFGWFELVILCTFQRGFVVASGDNAEPVIPLIAGMDKFQGPVVHTSVYRSGSGYKN